VQVVFENHRGRIKKRRSEHADLEREEKAEELVQGSWQESDQEAFCLDRTKCRSSSWAWVENKGLQRDALSSGGDWGRNPLSI